MLYDPDSIGYAPTPADTKPAQPCARYLSRVLREGENGPLWPRNHKGWPLTWDYDNRCQCGMGVAVLLWPEISDTDTASMAIHFGLPHGAAWTIFWDLHVHLGFNEYSGRNYVTPLDVSHALNTTLAAQVPA